MKEIIINKIKYAILNNYNDALDEEIVKDKLTDYFYDYDYIVGDWAYGKLRLKGFYNKENKKVKKINDFSLIDTYINEYCAFGCKYFILQKLENRS